MTATTRSSNWIQVGGWRKPWSELRPLELPSKAAVAVDGHEQAVLAVAAHTRSPQELLIASADRFDDELASELGALGFSIVRGFGGTNETVTAPTVSPPLAEPAIWLLTSGSTGRPKLVRHTLDSLTTVKASSRPGPGFAPILPGPMRGGRSSHSDWPTG